jgi:hypothetical protein
VEARMTDSVQLAKPAAFTTVKYTTKDGENVTATKKDGVVTLNGDKNGVRQMPLDDFVKNELSQNVKEIKTEITTQNENKTETVVTKPIDKAKTPVVGSKLDVVA